MLSGRLLTSPAVAGKEVLYETFYTRAPGSDALRKTATGRMKHLQREGWHEISREQKGMDSILIRFEREGATRPLPPLRTKPEPPPKRQGRGFGGPGGGGGRGFGGPGGGGGRGFGGPGGQRGGPPGQRGGPPGQRGGPPGRGGPPPSEGPPPGETPPPPAQPG
jgi:hypothetical protein